MYKTKFLAFAVVAILLAGILSNVSAQRTQSAPPRDETPASDIQPDLGEITVRNDISRVSAIELSTGETDYAIGTTFGATYQGELSGELPGTFFVSMNYTVPETALYAGGVTSTNGTPQPERSSQITGGSWTRLIYSKGEYIGSVYGRITGGTVTWGADDLHANISLQLAVDNGTQSLTGSRGNGNFEGTLDRTIQPAALSGTLALQY
jgi:hypothetical protein